ncbi:MAG: ABC transporter substrate-binding protein [Clostridia bacterium]|nr:ABC transporter substrate-binding protein [Clostridia bacterium]MBR1704984.1 ABC transporter substrate-binding protein [Clostridia bacterium]
MKRVHGTVRRLAALLMALSMMLLLAACHRDGDPITPEKNDTRKPAGVAEDTDIILPYSREEGVNPFSGTSLMNEAIMPLLYDGLYSIDEHYEPSMNLVEDITVNGTTLMLTMNANRRFSDGTVISADDVVYSYNMAKNSLYYGTLLSGISGVTAGGTTTVSFTLEKPNQFIAANLVFPVVKSGTADQKDDIPVGSGRYVYEDSDAGGVLKKSEQYKSERFKAEQIFLINIPNEETLFNSLNIETVNAAVDDISTGELRRVKAQSAPLPLNNLVYVGIRQNGNLADAAVRQALSALLDRKTLADSGMSGYAVQSDIPLNPDWFAKGDIKTQSMDYTKARDLLAESLRDQPIKVVTLSGNSFKEQIAKEVQRELVSAGVACEVEALEPAIYRSAVKSGLYDLYIGEQRLTNDMDITSVLDDKQLQSSWASVMSGTTTCETFMKGFYKQMPFLTIGFRTGVLAYSRNLKTAVKPLPGSPYDNVTEWQLG